MFLPNDLFSTKKKLIWLKTFYEQVGIYIDENPVRKEPVTKCIFLKSNHTRCHFNSFKSKTWL